MHCKQRNRVGRKTRRPLGFSNEKFLTLLSELTGVVPVGILGRDTPLDFTSLEAARGSLLMREVFSKYDDGVPSPDKEATTWKRFHEAEALCRRTNLDFYTLAKADPFWICVRRRVWDVLGSFSWDEASRYFDHGPGSTTRLPRSSAYAAYKYSGQPESTSGNAVLARCAIKHLPLWTQSVLLTAEAPDPAFVGPQDLVSVVSGNSVIAVPKNYKTDRTIAKEPCMNIYVQKGIGACIRKRLTRVGVNLNDQTRNQRAAQTGSIDGSLATVDLSMASDTLSYEVVSFLLPNDWWWALEQSRSPVGVLPCGTKIKYHKFSSMGNGYTFELESLIFWAICQQVCRSNINEREVSVCVYGDDLVVPSIHYESLTKRLAEAGFVPNMAKSFYDGPYRESCGKHYYLGSDITPFYVRKPVRELDRLFLVHNNVYRWGDRTGIDTLTVCGEIRKLAPASWRDPRLPDGYGDGAFIGNIDELRLDSHPYGWEFWQVSALVQTSIALEGDLPNGQLLASLRSVEARRSLISGSVSQRILAVASRIGTKQAYMARFEHASIDETNSGLPVKVGQYQTRKILIPRHPQPL